MSTFKVRQSNARNRRPPSELSNSFIIAALQDLEPQNFNGKWMTPCQYAVKKARSIGGKHFSIVPTAYWIGGQGGIERYAFKDVSNAYAQGYGFPAPTPAIVSRFKKGMQVRSRLMKVK